MRIERVGDLPPVQIGDDGDLHFAVKGSWPKKVGCQGDSRQNSKGHGADTATWTFLVAPGEYKIAATWAPNNKGATYAPFTVSAGAASFTQSFSQKQAPGEFADRGTWWQGLGTINVAGNVLTVRLSDKADGYVVADAVRIERTSPLGAAALAAQESQPLWAVTPPLARTAATSAAHDAVLSQNLDLYADLAWPWELARPRPKQSSSEGAFSQAVQQWMLEEYGR